MRATLSRTMRALLVIWVVAALLSLAWRGLTPAAPLAPLPPDTQAIELARAGHALRLAYRTWGSRADQDGAPRSVMLLLHGSPGSSDNFTTLGPLLAARHFVVAPDLPGFGYSSLDPDGVSIVDHSGHTLALLDALQIPRAHVLGYSMGGGVALHLWERDPERVGSLVLLSSIGVQEMEWLGDYTLNHGLYLLQLAMLRALDLAVPHFGRTDLLQRALQFARNFAETDQRPLRELLSRYDGPALVIHGEDDFLVPVEAAREHLRLMPQAQAWIAASDPDASFGADDHFMPFRARPVFTEALLAFVDAVDRGRAPTRATAEASRVAAAARPFDPAAVPPARGTFLWILLLLIALATFASEDLACVGAGLLAAQGRISFVQASAAAFVGIFVGDMLLFLAGRVLGRAVVRRAPLKWMLSEATLERCAAWFTRRGGAAIFVSRFTPGLRLPTYVAAGVAGTGVLRFAGWFALAGLAWTPALVALSMLAGRRVLRATDWVSQHTALSLLIVVATLVLVTRILPSSLTHYGRRRLAGRWMRLRHWEFWPLWMVYPPVLLWIGWLALKHRSLAVVTSVNPAIPASGIIGESKADILARLAGAGDALPKSVRLPGELSQPQRLARLDALVASLDAPWPLVLKPDVGQRGSGVGVCADRASAVAWLEHSPVDMLAQEYVGGDEFGVFWYRLPGASQGELFSITTKRLPEVCGDGERNLEQLLLDDARAPAMGAAYAEALGPRLLDVPAPGERVRLTELGTHCRGAVFEDGAELASDALRDALDRMAERLDGFLFGRFDLRAPSPQALREGRDLKVLELNGLTSEATHIYDRRHSILTAWRVLCRQWSIAFEIGAAQRARGVQLTPLREVLAMALAYRRAAARRRR